MLKTLIAAVYGGASMQISNGVGTRIATGYGDVVTLIPAFNDDDDERNVLVSHGS